MAETAPWIQSLCSPYAVPIPQHRLLREYISIPPAVCLKAVADILLLLHVHVVKLVDRDGIGWTRSAGRERAGGPWWRTLARALRWVHMSCIRTMRHTWLASPDQFGSVLE